MLESRQVMAYLRVSTKRQADEGNSLETQRSQALEYAAVNGLKLVESNIVKEEKTATKKITEDFFSEYTFKERPELYRLISLIKERKVSDLIVQCRDRLARNAEEYIRIKHILGTYGTKLHFTKASENFENEDDNATELVDFIFASIAELEANLISTRTYHGKKKCIEKNIWPGGKMPYGFFLAPSPYYPKKKIPHANPLEELHVKEIYRLYNVYGYGYTKISKLMSEKFTSRKWTKWDIKNILSNATYTGYIYWDRKGGRRNPNKQKKAIRSEKLPNAEIIGEAIWNETQNLRNRKLELNDPKYFDTPYLLKDKLYCAKPMPCFYYASMEDKKNGIETECNRKLATRDYGANKKKVYKCPRFSEDCRYTVSKMILEKEQLESAFLSKFKELVELKNINGLWELFSKEQETKTNEYKLAAGKIETDINQLSLKAFEVEHAFKVLHDTIQAEKKSASKNEEPSSADNKKTKVSDQQENEDDSISFSLRKQMHKLLVNTEKTLSQKKVEKEYIMACIKELDISKEQFENSLSAIVKGFDNMDNNNQRIIVDNVIDKVLITMHDDAINLDLIVNIHNL